MTPAASRRIAAYATDRSPDAPSDEVVQAAARAFLDTYAVAVAGAGAGQRVREVFMGSPGGQAPARGRATDWCTGAPLRADDAAFLNAVTGHVLDYDDVASPLRGHPSITMMPTLVALGEEEHATGAQLSRAYETGFEVMCKLARAVIDSHYGVGWHSTGTIGLIGAAVAGAQLLGLDTDQVADAIGLAVAQAAGTQQNFGTLAKSVQVGNAAAAAVRAVWLAQAGVNASHRALDGLPGGFVSLYSQAGTAALQEQLATLGAGPGELLSTGVEVKKYPLCYAAHRALDGLLDLRAQHALDLGRVLCVRVQTNRGGLAPLIHHRPQSGLAAKFSMEFALAAALRDGAVRLTTFDDAAVRSPDLQSFLHKVQAGEEDGATFPRWTEVRVERADGPAVEVRVERLRGSPELPLTVAELTDKVRDCFAFGGRSTDAERFAETVLGWRDRPISAVLAAGIA